MLCNSPRGLSSVKVGPTGVQTTLSCQGVLACGVGPGSYQPKGNIIFCVANAFHFLLEQPCLQLLLYVQPGCSVGGILLDNSNSLHEVHKMKNLFNLLKMKHFFPI